MENQRKIALITGGSRGLGKNMALRTAQKGLDIILTYRSKKEEAEEVVSAIEGLGGKAVALQLDTSQAATFPDFVKVVQDILASHFKAEKFDFLVNNAGIGLHTPIGNTAMDAFDQLVNIHLKGVYFLTQELLPLMNDHGAIVNISTGLARFTLPGYAAYAAMKGAVEVMSRYHAKELGTRGIRCNVVAPGAIETDFGGGAVRDNEEMNRHVANSIPLGRAGLPEDIGGVVAFLCTEDARWINGQRIEVSGGQNL